MNFLNAVQIRLKLPIIMMLLTFVAIVAMGTVSYQKARAALKDEAEARLVSLGSLKGRAVKAFFEDIALDLQIISKTPITIRALRDFTAAYAEIDNPSKELQRIYIDENPNPLGSKDQLVSAGNGSNYDNFHAQYHPYFDRLQDAHDYYDVFLFDTQGNLVYSVFKELDYATNMNTGKWKDSDLAEAFRRAMQLAENDSPIFLDFAPYEPSNGAPASFISRPVFSEGGVRLGVLVYQMPIEAINATFRDVEGLGETGDVFLVGEDQFLRTDSEKTEGNDILQTQVKISALSDVIAGESVVYVFDDLSNEPSVGYVRPMSFLGVTWALVATEAVEELYAPISEMQRTFVIYAIILLTLTLAMSLFLSRSISTPLFRVGTAMDAIANKMFDTTVPDTSRKDEIGSIANTLEGFRKSLILAEETAKEAAFKGAGFEVSGAAMFVCDPKLEIIFINRAMSQLVEEKLTDFKSAVEGIDPSKIVGLNMAVFSTVLGDTIENCVKPENLPLKKKLKVGDSFVGILFDAVHNPSGELVGYVAEWRDQTFQMSSEVIRKAIDSSQIRVELSLDRRIKSSNTMFVEMIGVSDTDVIGMDADALFTTPVEGDHEESIWSKVLLGQTIFGSFNLNRGGEKWIVEGSVSPLPDEKGNTGGYLLIAADVTEQRRAIGAAETKQKAMVEAQELVVQHLRTGLERLAVKDLSTQIEVAFSPENEQLRSDFNEAIQSLAETIATISERSEAINGDAESISSAADSLSMRTESQAAALEETAAALEELAASVNSAAEGAGVAANLVEDARSNAVSSGDVVKEAVMAMSKIENSSSEMSNIISAIDGIAFQTNLLALNAGVEAARAGEAGRGFAVVASEVRALAQRSSEAASQITALITSSSQQVSHGAGLVTQTGRVLETIISSVAEVSENVQSIAESAREQSRGISEISSSLNQLDAATQQNAAMVEETTAASHSLKLEANAMANAASQFKLSNRKSQPGTDTSAEGLSR